MRLPADVSASHASSNRSKRSIGRSVQVAAPLLASAALALLTGCRETQPKRCVDENNRVVDPSFCQTDPRNANNGYYQNHYHYYYGGSGGWSSGSIVSGGSSTPIAGQSYSPTTRGGFGGSSGGSGGGGEGGGGGE